MSSNVKLTGQHKRSLARIRKLVLFLIEKLEEALASEGVIDELPAEWKYIWGDKENAVSALTKLTGLLVKIIPMERQLLDLSDSEAMEDASKATLSDEDKEIIRRYFARYGKGSVQ